MNGFPGKLCRISLSHLSFMSGKRGQNLIRFLLGNFEKRERSPKLGRNLIELRRRNLEVAVSNFQADGSAARLCSRVLKRSAGNTANPQSAHEFKARKPIQVVPVPLSQGGVF